jgi:hypothetical protein
MTPRKVYRVNFPSGIRAIPAGNEMNVRMTGRRRLKKVAASPYFSHQISALSMSWLRINTYFP